MADPTTLDYVIVRENLEDAYVGIMGDADDLRATDLIGPRSRLAWSGDGLRSQDHHPPGHREGRRSSLRSHPSLAVAKLAK